MKILLVKDKQDFELKEYKNKLDRWGIDYEETILLDGVPFKNNDIDKTFLKKYCQNLYERRAEEIDSVRFFIKGDNWGINEPGKNIVGRHYGLTPSGYEVSVVKMRPGYENTAIHEDMHTFDDICLIYGNTNLSQVFGVREYDIDVVHGRSPRFTEYEYDAPYEILRPFLKSAIQKRKRMGMMSAYSRVLVLMRQWLVRINQQVKDIEHVPDKKSPREELYEAAKQAEGLDASPSDLAPDELGCAESVTNIIKTVVPRFPVVTGTWTLWDILRKESWFVVVDKPHPGDIVISPTGTGNGSIPGHVGIVVDGGMVMSSDSEDGKFKRNYTFKEWYDRYLDKGGYPTHFFRLQNKG